MRDTAYETQVLPVRLQSHRSVAELLGATASSPGDLAIVAQHWDLAADVSQSVPAYIVAAQAAQSTASHTEARQLLDRAQELAATLPESDEQALTELMIRTQRTVSTSSLYGYGYPEVFEDFTVAEEICRRLTNRPEIMPAQVGIWSYLLVRGAVDDAGIVLEPLTDVLDDPATAWFAPEIKSCMGYGAFYQGRLEDAHRVLVEAWEGYRARSDDAASSPFWPLPHDPVPITAVALACVCALQGATDESAMWEERAVTTAEELDFPSGPFSAAFVSVYVAWIRMITGNVDEARQYGQRTIEIAERCRFDYFQMLGAQYLLLPEPDSPCDATALEQYGVGLDLIGHSAFRPTHLGLVAANHHYLGNTDPALCALEEALERSTSSGELVHQPDLLRLRAEILCASDPERSGEAAKDLETAIDIGLAQGSLVLALRAANDLARLPRDRPPDWGDRMRAVLDRFPTNSTSPEYGQALDLLEL
jgi:tetratricopeptide (TPR) repeat protein